VTEWTRLRRAGQVTYMHESIQSTRLFLEKSWKTNDLRDTDIEGRIILKWIFEIHIGEYEVN
jgi:hypothetical protein